MSIHHCLCACVYALAHVSMHFYSTCRVRGSRFRLVSPRSRSRILARGLQVAYGAGLGENEISDPFTPILRPLQYHNYLLCRFPLPRRSYTLSPFHLHRFHLKNDIPVPVPILIRSSINYVLDNLTQQFPILFLYRINHNYCCKHARA